MPPNRTVNAKPMKTERTHEENQERAYIAASRRSDRSLEARIESARRASEIHKKRTGRSLRVTEQDVINEEMYEEEDDDLQSQYRRLQAHLGSSADLFSGRLNSWILSQYGTRQMAMGMPGFNPAMNMQQQMPSFFAYNPQQAASPNGTLSPQATQRTNQSFRQSPYPGPQYHRKQGEQRSHSISSPIQDVTQDQNNQRRSSMVRSDSASSPGTPHPQDGNMRPPAQRNGSTMQPGTLGHTAFFNDQMLDQMSPQFQFGGYPNAMSSFDPSNQMSNLLTTNMPNETQQILGNGAFDPSNPYTNMFMNSNHGMPMHQGVSYSYNPNLSSTKNRQGPQSEGINQTLSTSPMTSSPSKINTNVDNVSTPDLSANPMTASTNDSFPSHYGQHMHFDNGYGLGMDFARSPGAVTPKNEMYGDFNENEWIQNDEVHEI